MPAMRAWVTPEKPEREFATSRFGEMPDRNARPQSILIAK
jgi:hypothetical protein